MKKYSLSALVAAGLLAGGLATSANAADLGGNCCADLEERIAELEATTARKGNRKVSLTISGWVAEQVTWWDDGFESNTYVTGIGTTLGTNVKFTGQATISPGYSAGYVIHLEADGSDSLVGTDQDTPDGAGLFTAPQGAGLKSGNPNYVQTLQAFWFLKSDHLGKVGVGLQSMAADNTAILVDGSGSLVVANWVGFNSEGFFMRQTDGTRVGAVWAHAGGCNNGGDCYGIPINGVRYDTPTYAGFSASAGWGEDDYWDMAVRYAGEIHDFKVAAAAAYAEFDLLLDWTGRLQLWLPVLGQLWQHQLLPGWPLHPEHLSRPLSLGQLRQLPVRRWQLPDRRGHLPDLRDLVPQGRSPPELASARRDHSLRRVATQR